MVDEDFDVILTLLKGGGGLLDDGSVPVSDCWRHQLVMRCCHVLRDICSAPGHVSHCVTCVTLCVTLCHDDVSQVWTLGSTCYHWSHVDTRRRPSPGTPGALDTASVEPGPVPGSVSTLGRALRERDERPPARDGCCVASRRGQAGHHRMSPGLMSAHSELWPPAQG